MRSQHLRKFGVDIGTDAVRFNVLKIINRLIQSQTQGGSASAMPLKVHNQVLAFGLVRIKGFRNFVAGFVSNYEHIYRFLSVRVKPRNKNILKKFKKMRDFLFFFVQGVQGRPTSCSWESYAVSSSSNG
ncbi:MAG: hypothetical protein DRP45_03005 [Candidatus Zixiibacteriota bacterium]|nr:MAG: hypothetical protein DRP45_03005 [candidate division Zixibacteria bacterium]